MEVVDEDTIGRNVDIMESTFAAVAVLILTGVVKDAVSSVVEVAAMPRVVVTNVVLAALSNAFLLTTAVSYPATFAISSIGAWRLATNLAKLLPLLRFAPRAVPRTL